ncbi:GNAT family N-acetyltransferase [Kineococcus sp. SYSU DK018]|uniref:GNAT family N-acetyltransferase n=1 Tax=Kineococcus sp. SYSU DK018 TaxID=3383139 RepID=UPI003D7E72E4
MAGVRIRATTEDDWQRVRELRLEMLRDTPHAYLETLESALGHDEPEWRARARRGRSATGTVLVAVDEGGRWVGTMGGWLPGPSTAPLLVGVYVAPSHRGPGAGVADALLDGIEAWAAGHGPVLRLMVHEDNQRAQAFYARRGFRLTGNSGPYPLDPRQREVEMARELPPAAGRAEP